MPITLKTVVTKTFSLGRAEKVMKSCSVLTGGHHTSFNQMRHILLPTGNGLGQCHGLAVTWLKAKRRWYDPRSSSMVARSRFWDGRPTTLAKVSHRTNQQNITGTATMVAQYLALMTQQGFTRIGQKSFTASEIKNLGLYLIRPKMGGTRYFLIHTGGHTMASTCTGLSARFYDANSGEVVFASSLGLLGFLGLYFYDGYIRGNYFPGGSGLISVDEFRA